MTDGPRVRLLPDTVINRIAAGEVVERPASVVKELVENALDAGATRIEVEVDKGGRSLVAVRDDGVGMSRDDALLALERHATSKIRDETDLFRIASLGFRGEALPSIASVSRFELITGQRDAEAGTRLLLDGGERQTVEDAPNPGGTEIRVRRLFFNTPVRMKFLKSERTEMAHVVDAVNRLALSHPAVRFVLRSEERTLVDAPRAEGLPGRVASVLGRATAKGLRAFHDERGPLRLEGVLSEPSLHRSGREGLYLFVNGRFVRDRTLVGAVLAAYRGLVPRGRYPIVVLFLDLPPDQVDVNVHPAKVEVRFRDGASVWRFVGSALSDALARVVGDGAQLDLEPAPEPESPAVASSPPAGHRRASSRPSTRPVSSLASRAMDRAVPPPAGAEPSRGEDLDPLGRAGSLAPLEEPACSGAAAPWEQRLAERRGAASPWGRGLSADRLARARVLGHHSGGFLLCQLDEDLLLVDSHAAHERVLFDGLLARGAAGTRRLLVPELLELGRAAAERLDALRLPLAELGVDITLFGEDTVALQAVPRGLAPARVRQVLLGFAEADAELLPAAGGAAESLRYELAAQLACVGSLGPGERLDVEEGQLLLRCLAGSELGFCAPRGRRTVACFGPDEVARWLALER